MDTEEIKGMLASEFGRFFEALATEDGAWVVKGFIDIYKNIYTISVDTKVVSKIIELMLFPVISQFATAHGFKLLLSEHQNHYPDVTFIAEDETKYALDLKSTYRTSSSRVNGFTLGAFTGYFRQRQSAKNIRFPYGQYSGHLVLGVIYSRMSQAIDEKKVYSIDDLQNIISVVRDFEFLVQEKWRIASDRPGSGNTKNIGSIKSIQSLLKGEGTFAEYGESVFDDYWMNYLTGDMARAIDSDVPFKNLQEYRSWRGRAPLHND